MINIELISPLQEAKNVVKTVNEMTGDVVLTAADVGAVTKAELDEALEQIDLSDYYTKSEVDDKVANVKVDLTGYATEKYVDDKHTAQGQEFTLVLNQVMNDIGMAVDSTYAKKTDIPDVSAYQTEAQVIALIEAHGGSDVPNGEGVEF
jgi:hypothetical protein